MFEICKPSNKCFACGLCAAICPKTAIKLEPNEYGMLRPTVDENKCVKCFLCTTVCLANVNFCLHTPQKCYAAFDYYSNRVTNSASGGIAYLLYENFLQDGDGDKIIYGVCLNESMVPVFKESNTLDDIDLFRGSLYVQANVFEILNSIEENLKMGLRILAIALPCQIACIIKFLDNKHVDTHNLFIVDILCHGVVPQSYFLAEVEAMKKKHEKDPLVSVRFRSNKKDENYYIKYSFESGSVIKRKSECDYFFYGFLSDILLQDSCLECKFSQKYRICDLTIGDFIGLDRSCLSQEYRNRNVSIVMGNTDKGFKLLDSISKDTVLIERSVKEGFTGPSFHERVTSIYKNRDKFRKKLLTTNYYHAIRYTLRFTILKNKTIFYIKNIIKHIIGIKGSS